LTEVPGTGEFEQTYTLFDTSLSVRIEAPVRASTLESVLSDLSAEPAQISGEARLHLTVLGQDNTAPSGEPGRLVFEGDDLTIHETRDTVRVTDGDSVMTVRPAERHARVSLGASFPKKPCLLQRNFWAFAVAKLLRTVGLYTLHAAGLVSPNGTVALLIGKSGSGKSTLAIGLARAGWRILSDDALVLRESPNGIEALGLRKHLYIDGTDAERYADFGLTPAQADKSGGTRFRLDLGDASHGRLTSPAMPSFLVFPTIARTDMSQSRRIPASDTVGRLLEASGPQLLDRASMGPHLHALTCLTRQAVAIDLQSGAELHAHPERLAKLLDTNALLGHPQHSDTEQSVS